MYESGIGQKLGGQKCLTYIITHLRIFIIVSIVSAQFYAQLFKRPNYAYGLEQLKPVLSICLYI